MSWIKAWWHWSTGGEGSTLWRPIIGLVGPFLLVLFIIAAAVPSESEDAPADQVSMPAPTQTSQPAPTQPPVSSTATAEPTALTRPTPTVKQALKALIFCDRVRLNAEIYWGVSPITLQNLDPRFSGTLEPGDYIRILTPESKNGAIRVKVYPHDFRSVSNQSDDEVWIDWDILVLQPEHRFDQLIFTCED